MERRDPMDQDDASFGGALAPRAFSPAASDSSTSSMVAPATICDECEDQSAALECEDCGLVYCVACDKRCHRKGKLVFHQRKRLELTAGSPPSIVEDVACWSEAQVADWLSDHELDVFLSEVAAHHIDGAFLLSPQMDVFVDSLSTASRGHKKKLLREIQKLKTDSADTASTTSATSSFASPNRMLHMNGVPSPLSSTPSPVPGAVAPTFAERSSLRRMGVNLRVNIDTPPPPPPERPFSPVTSLRARATHGQVDGLKGRVRRSSSGRYSELVLDENASTPIVNLNKSVERRATPVEPVASFRRASGMPPPLQIDMSANRNYPSSPSFVEDAPARDLKSIRQALGGLDMEMVKVKKDGRSVEASFDFSAEGRLQTQGFEINTNGIATAPFPDQEATNKRKQSPHGTREYLVLLNELGHGASGKVYKALYVPTFKLVAVKVIRVFDQKKRHQMVRELKSLYTNWAPIDDTTSKAACEELVIFFDAYTNPEIGSVSIVLEFMDGGSLEEYMQKQGRTSERELASIAYFGLKGLAFLHEHHQLHRDIKLSNMLINQEGQVKISDFGISRDLESTLAKAATFTGTLLYMAPERISGGLYSYPSDIWSFGLAVMACAIGKLPVPTKEGYWGVVHAVQDQPSPKLSDFGEDYSPELCDFIDLCLRKNPMTRPPASQLLEHPFIKKNYQPGVRHSIDVTASVVQQKRDKQLQELDMIVKQVRSWYQDRADTLRSPSRATTGDGADALLHRVSHADKMLSLAKQLRVPVDLVTEKFKFMETY